MVATDAPFGETTGACPRRSCQYVLFGAVPVRTVSPPEPDAPGADELLQPVRADELLERVDVLGRPRELEDDRVGAEVDDARAEHLSERHQLRALRRRRRHLHEHELALDRLAGDELRDAEHVHELVHLLLYLLERARLAVDPDGDARHVVALGRADGQAVDVEPAAGEQAGDAHEHSGLVLDEDAQRVLHAVTSSTLSVAASSNSTRSSAAAPAGIIGKQCSRGSTRASTTAVRPQASASASAPSRSFSFSTVKPSAPYARASAA